jgi:hypothetical protein
LNWFWKIVIFHKTKRSIFNTEIPTLQLFTKIKFQTKSKMILQIETPALLLAQPRWFYYVYQSRFFDHCTIVRGLKNLQGKQNDMILLEIKPLTYDWLWFATCKWRVCFEVCFICFAMLLLFLEQQTAGIYLWMSLLIIIWHGIIVLGNQYFSKCIGDCIYDLVEKEAKWNLHLS